MCNLRFNPCRCLFGGQIGGRTRSGGSSNGLFDVQHVFIFKLLICVEQPGESLAENLQRTRE